VLTPAGPRQAWVVATNVYLKTAQGWRLVAHHASPGSATEVPEIVDTPQVLH
jgi:ketosteroid isomerase-like protein